MDIEEEVLKIIGGRRDNWSTDNSAHVACAQNDYKCCKTRCRECDRAHCYQHQRDQTMQLERCIQLRNVIKRRLFEALSCPIAYIREWGRLVAKEKEDAARGRA